MEGGAGNDTYLVDAVGDLVVEQPGEGYDRILASIGIFTLQPEIERLDLVGTADLEAEGNEAANLIIGNAGANRILGAGGNDTLDGGAGADSLVGRAGDDIHRVRDPGDLVFEEAGGGMERVIAYLDRTLAAELERLSLVGTNDFAGTGNELANVIVGTAGANRLDGRDGNDTLYGQAGDDTLTGGAGDDRLDGRLGADTMAGGAGDDTYVVDNAGDVVREEPGGGRDRVITSVDWTLGAELEWLTLSGTADLSGTGNELANRIDGNAGANRLESGDGPDSLYGRDGNDTLIGGDGNDRLEGGLGADRFVFASPLAADGDLIADFSAAEGDRISLTLIDANLGVAGNQAFSWIGGDIIGGAAGQLRFAEGVLEGDLDGDGIAYFRIALAGVTSMAAGSIWM